MPTPRYIDRPDSSAADEFKSSLNNMVNTMLERKRRDQDFELELLKDTQEFQRGLWAEERARKERLDAEERAEDRYQRRREESKSDAAERLDDQRRYAEEVRDEARTHAELIDQNKGMQVAINGYLVNGGSPEEIEDIVEKATRKGNRDTSISSLFDKDGVNKVDEVINALKAATFKKAEEVHSEEKMRGSIEALQLKLAELRQDPTSYERDKDETDSKYRLRLITSLRDAQDGEATRKINRDFSTNLFNQARAAGLPLTDYTDWPLSGGPRVPKSDADIIKALEANRKEGVLDSLIESSNFQTWRDLDNKLNDMASEDKDVKKAKALSKVVGGDLTNDKAVAELRRAVLLLWVSSKEDKFARDDWALDRKLEKLLIKSGKPDWTIEYHLGQEASRKEMLDAKVLKKEQYGLLEEAAKKGTLKALIEQLMGDGGDSFQRDPEQADELNFWLVQKVAAAEKIEATQAAVEKAISELDGIAYDAKAAALWDKIRTRQNELSEAREAFLKSPVLGLSTSTMRDFGRGAAAGTSLPPATGAAAPTTGAAAPTTGAAAPGSSLPDPYSTQQGRLSDAKKNYEKFEKQYIDLAKELEDIEDVIERTEGGHGRESRKKKTEDLKNVRKALAGAATEVARAEAAAAEAAAADAPSIPLPQEAMVPSPQPQPAPREYVEIGGAGWAIDPATGNFTGESVPLPQRPAPLAPAATQSAQGVPVPAAVPQSFPAGGEDEVTRRYMANEEYIDHDEQPSFEGAGIPDDQLVAQLLNRRYGIPPEEALAEGKKTIALIASYVPDKSAVVSVDGKPVPPAQIASAIALVEEARALPVESLPSEAALAPSPTQQPVPRSLPAPEVPILPSVGLPTSPQQSIPVPQMAPQPYAPSPLPPTSVPRLPATQAYIPAQSIDPQLSLPAAAPAMIGPQPAQTPLPSLPGRADLMPSVPMPSGQLAPLPQASVPMPMGPDPRNLPMAASLPAVALPGADVSSIPTPMGARALTPAESLGRPSVPLLSEPEPSLDYVPQLPDSLGEEPMEGPQGDLAPPAPDDLEIEGDHSRVTALLMKKGDPVEGDDISIDEAQEGAAQIMEMVMRVKAGQPPVEGLGPADTAEYTKKLMLLIKEAREMPIEDVRTLLQRRYTPEIPSLPGANPAPSLPTLPGLPGARPAPTPPPPGLPPLPK